MIKKVLQVKTFADSQIDEMNDFLKVAELPEAGAAISPKKEGGFVVYHMVKTEEADKDSKTEKLDELKAELKRSEYTLLGAKVDYDVARAQYQAASKTFNKAKITGQFEKQMLMSSDTVRLKIIEVQVYKDLIKRIEDNDSIEDSLGYSPEDFESVVGEIKKEAEILKDENSK